MPLKLVLHAISTVEDLVLLNLVVFVLQCTQNNIFKNVSVISQTDAAISKHNRVTDPHIAVLLVQQCRRLITLQFGVVTNVELPPIIRL